MNHWKPSRHLTHCVLGAIVFGFIGNVGAEERLVLQSESAQATFTTGGGGLIEFRFRDQTVNPLNWKIAPELETSQSGQPDPQGHFLCLDRWGAPSAAEVKNGVPFHGEAPRVVWKVLREDRDSKNTLESVMSCTLPLAGLTVKREMKLDAEHPVLLVTERVTNTNPLGRVYNMVQHPTIAPPFLGEETVIDTNAAQGFVQSGKVPADVQSAFTWPNVLVGERKVDLRRLVNTADDVPASDVSSFVFDDTDTFGWVTACNPQQRLLIGYLWKTSAYPWLNIWRYRFEGQVSARGLEFGTTGYHQPYPILVKTGKILRRPLFDYIDAGETVSKTYAVFLFHTPADYLGVSRLSYENGRLTLTERRTTRPRLLTADAGELFQD